MKKLFKVQDSWLFGVVGGIAKFFGISPDVCRIIFIILLFVPHVSIVLVTSYIILAIFMPKEVKEEVKEE